MFDQLLAGHETIALDFDETLMWGPQSDALRAWVAQETGRRQFHIVTHRSHGWQDEILRLLANAHPHPLLARTFRSVANVPDDLWTAQNEARFLEASGDDLPPDIEAGKAAFLAWKGQACRALGCTVLVDDSPDTAMAGCHAAGVSYLNIREMLLLPHGPTGSAGMRP